MKMNRFRLISTLAAAGFCVVLSDAMALTFNNDFSSGTMQIGGTISVPPTAKYWQWITGDALEFPNSMTTDMSTDYKTLNLKAASNVPVLVGQTTAATLGSVANVGLNPVITFAGSGQGTVVPVWDSTGATGKGSITVPVLSDPGNAALGTLTMKVKVGAVRAIEISGAMHIQSLYDTGGTTKLYGQNSMPTSEGVFLKGTDAAEWNAKLGTKTADELRTQLNTASNLNVGTWNGADNHVPALGFNEPTQHFSGSYGLGIVQDDPITVTFTNPVTTTTKWKAPLTATITYM